MGGWRGWWLLWLVPLVALVVTLAAVFRRSDDFLLFITPLLVASTGASLMGYRRRHGFWPWDMKRRKIERWRWMVESSPSDRV